MQELDVTEMEQVSGAGGVRVGSGGATLDGGGIRVGSGGATVDGGGVRIGSDGA